MSGLLLVTLFSIILLSPIWIRMVSTRAWQSTTKNIAIVVLVMISAGTTIYGFLRPQTNPSSWSIAGGKAILIVYLVAVLLSAYFNWPRERKESVKSLVGNPKGKPPRKNRAYVSIPLMTGSDGDVSVTFHHATLQQIKESKKRYPDPDFGSWLIEQIYNAKKIMAERKGAFKKRLFCSSCGAELSPEYLGPKQIELELRYKDFKPFVMQITIPSVACPQCNKVCGVDLDGSLNDHLSEAIIAAFRSENIKPW
jgi:hypothetical protein